jgi:hypothetical protein
MAFKLASRTRQYVTSTGAIGVSAVMNLGGVTNTDLNSFVASVGDNNQTIVCVASGNGVDWQECVVTVDDASPDTLTVDEIIKSSIAGVIGTSAITLAGTSKAFGIIPTDFDKLFDKLFGSATGNVPTKTAGGPWVGAVVGGSKQTAANTANHLTWTGLTKSNYAILVNGLTPATNGTDLWLQFGTGAGPTWIVTGYHCANRYIVEGSGINGLDNAATQIGIKVANAVDNTNGGYLGGKIEIFSLAEAIRKTAVFNSNRLNGGVIANLIGFGTAAGTTAVTAVRLITGAGNLLSGSASLFEIS